MRAQGISVSWNASKVIGLAVVPAGRADSAPEDQRNNKVRHAHVLVVTERVMLLHLTCVVAGNIAQCVICGLPAWSL